MTTAATAGITRRSNPEGRLVLAVVPGPRDVEAVEQVVGEVKDRTGGRVLDLATSDEYPACRTALREAYGEELTTTATGRRARRMVAEEVPPAGMNYATVEKRRARGRVVEVVTRVTFGTMAGVQAALARSGVSRKINASLVGRRDGTDRHRNARKVRETCTSSKDWSVHEAMTHFTTDSDNFCRAARTLRGPIGEGVRRGRTPAMAAGWADHIGTIRGGITMPGVQRP